jgi:multidrug efflux pump subunit AcrA (membrane-fusion protein)
VGLGAAAAVVLIGAATAYGVARSFLHAVRGDLLTHKVEYGRLELTIVERGSLESANNNDIVCRVKARNQQSQTSTTIKSVIDDGSHVKKGDLLVDLDDSGLLDQLTTEKITLDKAESDWLQAEENYKIQVTQNESDVLAAENALKLAQIELKKFLEGDFPANLSDLEGKVKTADSDLEQQRDRTAWAQRMLKKGYYTVSQTQSEESKLESYQLAKKKAETDLDVLKRFTKEHDETNFRNKVREAELGLQKARSTAKANELVKKTDRDAKKSVHEQEAGKYKDIQDEIKKCKLYAPQDGLVVYYVAEQTRWGVGRQAIVAQGEAVAENQKLMQIPDLKHMLVNTKVHEAQASRVHENLPATVRVLTETLADRRLKAHVESVANTASQQDFFAADVKVYATKVAIDEDVDGLKPGMTAEVTINIADALDHVLTIPIEAIIGSAEMGKRRKCFVLTPSGPQERDIVIGASNDKEAEVRDGLQEGDEVVLNPKLLIGDKAKTRQPGAENGNGADQEDKGDAKGSGKKVPGAAPAGPGQAPGGPAQSPGGPPAGPGGPGPKPAGTTAGPGGPSGPTGGQFTEEDRKRMEQQTVERFKNAKPADRKAMLEKVPDQWRDAVRQLLQKNNVEIPN